MDSGYVVKKLTECCESAARATSLDIDPILTLAEYCGYTRNNRVLWENIPMFVINEEEYIQFEIIYENLLKVATQQKLENKIIKEEE